MESMFRVQRTDQGIAVLVRRHFYRGFKQRVYAKLRQGYAIPEGDTLLTLHQVFWQAAGLLRYQRRWSAQMKSFIGSG